MINRFLKFLVLVSLFALWLVPGAAHCEDGIKSVTLEGGPIWSKHFQRGDEDFRNHHGLGVLKVHTRGYGNWAVYALMPNSVDRTSIGAGYVTNPYVLPLGSLDLELSGAVGLVTGYQDYPVPLLVGQARLVFYRSGPWDTGLSAAALPYYTEDRDGDDNEFGIVATTPFLSIRYNF